ncbi:MAG: SGNH/GDSL hydrolase family protein [Marinobacter sp.]|nr:SGNH/GDSL hydrolase family protein [Marinobacter sp.]
MLEWLTTLALGPVLIAQGLYTRVRTLKLPEARGDREGHQGEGPAISVLVLGDSAAAGVGVEMQDQALAGQLVRRLGQDFAVTWTLLAKTGLKAREVLNLLDNASVGSYDVALLSVGVNDVTGSTGVSDWVGHMEQLIVRLKTRHQVRHIILSPVPPMHAFPALPQPLRWWLGQRARRFNENLAAFVAASEDCCLVQGELPVDLKLMAADGFHPGNAAYDLWAQTAALTIRQCLDQASQDRSLLTP